MLKKIAGQLKATRKEHRSFFYFAVGVLVLYLLQFVAKTEITPLGYFSLYSDPAYPQQSYRQVLPADPTGVPVNIYEAKGQGFLMLEILPSRYDILRKSDHCNQMNHKLQRLGMHDKNTIDCPKLQAFHDWFGTYMKRQGIGGGKPYRLMDFGFDKGQLIQSIPLDNAH